MRNKAVFLDKDGTLVENVPYNVDPGNMRLQPGVTRGLTLLSRLDFKLIVVSNQSGVAKGYFPESALVRMKRHLESLIARHLRENRYLLGVKTYADSARSGQRRKVGGESGEHIYRVFSSPAMSDRPDIKDLHVRLADFYYCPHCPDGSMPAYSGYCSCRKPAPGLLLRAAREHNIDLSQSWLIGDILNDIEAGQKAGCKTVLVNNGGETEWVLKEGRIPDYIVADFYEAAYTIEQIALKTLERA
jgi:D-glycero-D-manno-heptose 1,7-bisphosphate phosphatase